MGDDRAEEDRPCEEQGGEDREQEEEPCGEEERVDRRREQGARCPEDQGFLRGEEGHPAVQEGEGSWPENHVCLFPWRTGRLLWDAGASCSLSERWAWPPRRGPMGPMLSCTPVECL